MENRFINIFDLWDLAKKPKLSSVKAKTNFVYTIISYIYVIYTYAFLGPINKPKMPIFDFLKTNVSDLRITISLLVSNTNIISWVTIVHERVGGVGECTIGMSEIILVLLTSKEVIFHNGEPSFREFIHLIVSLFLHTNFYTCIGLTKNINFF